MAACGSVEKSGGLASPQARFGRAREGELTARRASGNWHGESEPRHWIGPCGVGRLDFVVGATVPNGPGKLLIDNPTEPVIPAGARG